MHKVLIAGSFVLGTLFSSLALTQIAPQTATVTDNQPGKVSKVATVRESVVVTKINKATRTLTMKNAAGQIADVVAGAEVRNFDQIKTGDSVVVEYTKAISLALKKAGDPATPIGEAVTAVRAKPGEKPAGVVGHSITTVAEVIDVDPERRTMTLQGKGPEGRIVVLDVKNPDHFKVVKEGDMVEVNYAEAIALSVRPALQKSSK
jgi:hypothetical protein